MSSTVEPPIWKPFRRWPVALVVLVAAAALTACSSGSGNGTDATPDSAPSTITVPPQDPVETPCLSTSPAFASRGTVSVLGGAGPDATQLSGIDWLTTDDCERIVFGFVTDEAAPASSIGLSRLEFYPEQAVLRVTMPRDVDVTAVADTLVDGRFIERAFVVQAHSGDLSVDLHLAGDVPIEARGFVVGSPVRLVVDVRATEDDVPGVVGLPTRSDSVVVLAPAPGPADYPIRIRGYARSPDGVVTARLEGQGPAVDRRVTASSSMNAWGEFALTISEGPTGDVVLLLGAGDHAPTGGVEIGLEIP